MRAGRALTTRLVAACAAMFAAPAAVAAVSCSIATAGVSFGVYDASLATPTDSVGTIEVICSYVAPGGGTPVHFAVMLGTGQAGNYLARTMVGPTGSLQYNLYQDGARSVIWGNGLGGTGVASGKFAVGPGVGNNTRRLAFPIYGRIPPQQSVRVGNYTDTITVTLEF